MIVLIVVALCVVGGLLIVVVNDLDKLEVRLDGIEGRKALNEPEDGLENW
jgi:hypothetical protein